MKRASREVWARRVDRWRDSGLTSKEFAAEMGVNPRTLAYWKWRLGKEADETAARKRSGPKRTEQPTKPTFVEMSPPQSPVLSTPLEVVVGTGLVVRVPVGFDAETLGRVVSVLEARA